MIANGFRERAEDNAHLRKLALKCRRHGYAVKHRVYSYSGEKFLLLQRNAELLISAQQLRINLFHALELRFLLRRSVISDVLIINGRVLYIGPLRLCL